MPLFGGKRDISLFRNINREIINKIIDTEIDYYKISLVDTNTNLYGESDNKIFFLPVRVHSIIGQLEDQETMYKEYGVDVDQTNTFSFLKDDLRNRNLVPEVGDVIHWNEIYWEIDRIIENKYFMQRNHDTNKTIGRDWGWSVDITCVAHSTRRTKLDVEESRFGDN
jgi:hypothetical protein